MEKNAFDVAAAILNAVPESVFAERREKAAASLDNLIAWLPEPESWAVASDDRGAVAHLLAANKVFTLSLRIDRQSPDYFVEATSRVLDDRIAAVSVSHASRTQGKTPTRWEIRYGDGTSLKVVGTLGDDDPHSSERFARAVAARLGWTSQDDGVQ